MNAESIKFKDFFTYFQGCNNTHNLVSPFEIRMPSVKTFYVESSFKELNKNQDSPFMILTAPGATGKSALSAHLAQQKNMYLWDLAGVDVGANYFIGTLTKSFGPASISTVIANIQNGKIGFVIDAFDEAEVACGWERIQNFISEIYGFVKNVTNISIVLIARRETADCISFFLEQILECKNYGYYQINFFSKEKAKEFLSADIKNRIRNTPLNESRMLEVFEHIASRVDSLLSQKKGEADFAFYGYAPVIQAISRLFAPKEDEIVNFQSMETKYKNDDFTQEIIVQIITDILTREQGKFLKTFKARPAVSRYASPNINKLYSISEQLYYLISKVFKNNIEIAEEATRYGLPDAVIKEYLESIRSIIGNHPFLLEGRRFVSGVFRDFCTATLLVKECYQELVLPFIEKSLATITPLFWDFYIHGRKEKEEAIGKQHKQDIVPKIDGIHVGILYESYRSLVDDESMSAIYKDNEILVLSLPSKQENQYKNTLICPSTKLVFYNHLRNISVHIDIDIELYSSHDKFILSDASIYTTKAVVLKSRNLEVICNNLDSPVSVISTLNVEHFPDFSIEKLGKGDFFVCFPKGKKYPFSEYFKEFSVMGKKDIGNAMMALRTILRWFRRDRRDSIARYKPLIDTVVSSSTINTDMLQYLLEQKVLWQDGSFYKMTSREAAKKGIHFGALLNAVPDENLTAFLERFIRQ